MKYLVSFILFIALTSTLHAKQLDVGVAVPSNLGESFKGEKVSYDPFKGQPTYLLVWDSANKDLLRNVLRSTKDTPAPVVVLCVGRIKVGSRQRNFNDCEFQTDILNNERVTLVKKKRAKLDKKIKIPKTDHLFVVDDKGVVVQKLALRSR